MIEKKKKRYFGRKVSEDRMLASRYASYYAELKMIEWSGLAETLPAIANHLKVSIIGMRRSQIAIACMQEMKAGGLILPDGYIPPWERPSAMLIVKSHDHKEQGPKHFLRSNRTR